MFGFKKNKPAPAKDVSPGETPEIDVPQSAATEMPADDQSSEQAPQKKGLFARLKAGLTRTRSGITGAHDWKSTETLIRNLVDIASKGGNYLLNIGPAGDGL